MIGDEEKEEVDYELDQPSLVACCKQNLSCPDQPHCNMGKCQKASVHGYLTHLGYVATLSYVVHVMGQCITEV